jgi:ubiquinone/menaquinone biosynthesis C-methylase UbiE
MISNKEMYKTWEFDRWAFSANLDRDDKFLFTRYFNKKGKTLEAGTGGGRLLFGMQAMGFDSLHGFDFVPDFIEIAKQKDRSHRINFQVQDAINLNYENNSFEQIVYLQNMISSIDPAENRQYALKEAYRILRPGGVGLFSFLNFHARVQLPIYRLYLHYLKSFRRLSGSDRSIQEQPWLNPGKKPNWLAFFDRGPYVYWYKAEEAYQQLRNVGFQMVALGSSYQIAQEKMLTSLDALCKEPIQGGLYFVCSK